MGKLEEFFYEIVIIELEYKFQDGESKKVVLAMLEQ